MQDLSLKIKSLFYFHVFPVYFLPANILIILPATWVLYLGILVLLIPSGIIHSWLSWALQNLIELMNEILLLFEQLPYATLKGVWITTWQYLLLYALLLGCISFLFFKKKNTLYLIVGCLLLLICFRVPKMKNQSLNEIRIYNVYRGLAIGFFDQSGTIFFTDSLTENSSRFQYSVKPNIEASVHSSQMKIVNLGESFIRENLLITNNIIQFNNKSLLIYSEEQSFVDSILIDLVYIRNNAKIELQQVRKSIQFKWIIVDSSNSDWYIKQIEKEAKLIGVSVYILKNNFAYVW